MDKFNLSLQLESTFQRPLNSDTAIRLDAYAICHLSLVQVRYTMTNMCLHHCLVGTRCIEIPSDMQHTYTHALCKLRTCHTAGYHAISGSTCLSSDQWRQSSL